MSETESLANVKLKPKEIWSIIKWALRIYLKVDKPLAITLTILRFIETFDGIIYSFLFAKIIDTLIFTAQQQTKDFTPLILMVSALVLSSILFRLEGLVLGYLEEKYNLKFNTAIEVMLDEKVMSLGIQNLENPEIANRLHRANNSFGNVIRFINIITDLINTIFTSVSRFVIVFTIAPILTVIYILLSLPVYFVDKKFRGLSWRFSFDETENRRRANNVLAFLSAPSYLEEVLILGAGKFLLSKFTNYMSWYNDEKIKILKRWNMSSFFVRVVKLIANGLSLIIVFSSYITGKISIGTVTFQIDMIRTFQNNMDMIMRLFNSVSEMALTIRDVQELMEIEPITPDGNITFPKLEIGPEIKFENVTFAYPNTEKNIFSNLNLHIKSGEKIAIVGENGAGKTTLVKLILRYYKIKNGEIFVNGHSLNDLVIDSYYRNVGLLSQEFNQYGALTAKENVQIGQIHIEPDDKRLETALSNSEALKFVKEFKFGFDQVLSERFKNGLRPSTGQWQKLALARFFYRNSPLVIFDEPTSSIDAVSEYNIFNKIYSFFTNKTVLIISHRFSTVRSADRILVVDGGTIVEEGSHDELMKLNGKYAKSFLLQAEGYTNSIV